MKIKYRLGKGSSYSESVMFGILGFIMFLLGSVLFQIAVPVMIGAAFLFLICGFLGLVKKTNG